MAYVSPNFKTKKALKDAVLAGQRVTVFQPGPFGGDGPQFQGRAAVEGPHYPEPHRWYAEVVITAGCVTAVK